MLLLQARLPKARSRATTMGSSSSKNSRPSKNIQLSFTAEASADDDRDIRKNSRYAHNWDRKFVQIDQNLLFEVYQ